jgi:O-antigen ligase
MTARPALASRASSSGRLLWWIALAAAGGIAFATARQPTLGLAFVAATVLAAIAIRSPALPLALSGSSIAALVLGGRLPKGGTVGLYAAWILFGILVAVLRGRDLPRLSRVVNVGTVAFVLLLTLLLLRLPASGDPGYGKNKLALMLVLALLPMVAGIVVGFREQDRRLLLGATALIGVATAAYGAVLIVTGGASGANTNRLSLDDSIDPIGLGRSMGTVILVLLYFFIRAEKARTRLLALVAIMPAAVVLIGSGSRGPLLGIMVAVPVLLFGLAVQPAALKRAVFAVIGVVVGGAIAVATVVPAGVSARVLSIFGSTEQAGELSRYALWSDAITIWSRGAMTALFGVGTGGYAALTAYPPTFYPHNLVLETGVEYGVVGVLVLLVGVGWIFARAFSLTRVPGEQGAFAAYLLSVLSMDFVTAQFSGDLPYNADLWVTSGLVVGLAADVVRRRSRTAVVPASTAVPAVAGPAAPAAPAERRHVPLAPLPPRPLPDVPAMPTIGPRGRSVGVLVTFWLFLAFTAAAAGGVALQVLGDDRISLPTGDGSGLTAPWRGWTLALFGGLAVIVMLVLGRRRVAVQRVRALAVLGFVGVAVTGIGMLAGSPAIAAGGFTAAALTAVIAALVVGGIALRGLLRAIGRRL